MQSVTVTMATSETRCSASHCKLQAFVDPLCCCSLLHLATAVTCHLSYLLLLGLALKLLLPVVANQLPLLLLLSSMVVTCCSCCNLLLLLCCCLWLKVFDDAVATCCCCYCELFLFLQLLLPVVPESAVVAAVVSCCYL